MIRTIRYPVTHYTTITFDVTDEQNNTIESLTDREKAELLFKNLSEEEQEKTSVNLICEHMGAGLFNPDPLPGICRVCGCTENDACTSPAFGNCWWADETETLCSHCASDIIKNDLFTRGPINVRTMTSI